MEVTLNLSPLTIDSFKFDVAVSGHYYAIGVGPGSPDLLTIRAAKIIESADVIITPRAATAESSLALDTIRHLLKPSQKIVDHQYSMIRDEDATIERWKPIADTMIDYCKSQKSVAQITIGDPLIYSTVAYVFPYLYEQIGEDRVHVIPGISAFQITASKFGIPLTTQEDRLCIMPATDLDAVKDALTSCETLVLYKCAKKLASLAEILKSMNLDTQCKVVCYAEQGEKETVYNDIHEAAACGNGYMATAIIFIGRKKWGETT
jgi:precorrin-2/cobalt-factor-2 C20-methyltransferase